MKASFFLGHATSLVCANIAAHTAVPVAVDVPIEAALVGKEPVPVLIGTTGRVAGVDGWATRQEGVRT